jgi:hypothetical protein
VFVPVGESGDGRSGESLPPASAQRLVAAGGGSRFTVGTRSGCWGRAGTTSSCTSRRRATKIPGRVTGPAILARVVGEAYPGSRRPVPERLLPGRAIAGSVSGAQQFGARSNPAGLGSRAAGQPVGKRGRTPAAALQVSGERSSAVEQAEVVFLLGQAENDREPSGDIVGRYPESAEQVEGDAGRHAGRWWDGTLGALQVHTPVLSVDLTAEPVAALSGAQLPLSGVGSALYQSGGAFGFRDQLQDCDGVGLYAAAADLPGRTFWRRRRASSPKGTCSTGGMRIVAAGCARAARTTCCGCRLWWRSMCKT